MVGNSKASSANRDRAMRVLELINTSESAKEILLGRALYLREKHGVEAQILCSPGAYVDTMREVGIVVHVLDTPRAMRPLALTRSYLELIRLLRRERYEILHSHGSVLGLLTRLARPFTTAAIVHTRCTASTSTSTCRGRAGSCIEQRSDSWLAAPTSSSHRTGRILVC